MNCQSEGDSDNFTLLSAYVYFKEKKALFYCILSCVSVSKEQSKSSKKDSGPVVQEEERQSKPNTKKCGLTGVSNKPTKGSSQVSTKKRKMVVEMLEKKKKKNKI